MTIAQIYKKYHITPTLQEHMINVAAVAICIINHWTEAQLDRNLLANSLLLHDMGNIVKFNFDKYKELLGLEQKNVAKWTKIQQEFIKKYGKNAHQATLKILQELKVNNPQIIKIISLLNPDGAFEAINSHEWHYKIAYYADARISPNGLVSLKERFDDLQKRYAHQKAWQPKVTQERYRACQEIERQLQAHCSRNLNQIKSNDLREYFAELKNLKIN